MQNPDLELAACTPEPVSENGFNPKAQLPLGVLTEHIRLAMLDFTDFLSFINLQLYQKGIVRLETMLMQANFSSMVGEFMHTAIPKYCPTVVKNRYHNGHPDLIARGQFPGDAVQHHSEGIEIKASRRKSGWQGHNPEDTWLMVFVFEANSPIELIPPKPFKFLLVAGARLSVSDWSFSGRSSTSRRTPTASILLSGLKKMMENWIYKAPETNPAAVLEETLSE